MNQFSASMPSNIALIKYMGKLNAKSNLPYNASLSYTLPHLRSTVTLTENNKREDTWDISCQLNEKEKQRFTNHLQHLRARFDHSTFYEICSENNFPAGCGLASSASSFAALTACAIKAFDIELPVNDIASLSREGSGSSCRSFFSPFALWRGHKVEEIKLPYSDLKHFVIVISRDKKAVSSSEAHQRVASSLLFDSRSRRADYRLNALIESFERHDWEKAFYICWQEFWDMFALFETCEQPFNYLLPASLHALTDLRQYWEVHRDGPLVTMDAGPNIHLLFRPDQLKHIDNIQNHFGEMILSL